MTKQIDELMWLAQKMRQASHQNEYEATEALRTALEAALKPGEPHHWIVPEFGFLFPTEDAARRYLENIGSQEKPTACYTAAPPAQTPQKKQAPSWWPAVEAILNEYGLQAIDFVADWKQAQATPPPRLTDAEIDEFPIIKGEFGYRAHSRAIETAVRRQWAKQFGVNDE